MSPELGCEVGGQRKGWWWWWWWGKFHRCALFFQIKRANDNMQQKEVQLRFLWRGVGVPARLMRVVCQNCICLVFSEEYCIVSHDTDSSFSPFPFCQSRNSSHTVAFQRKTHVHADDTDTYVSLFGLRFHPIVSVQTR